MVKKTDPSGNVTSYAWDNRGRLSSLTIKNSSLVTLQVVNYTYDAMNQLIGESVSYYSGGTVYYTSTQRFAYDPRTGQMQLAFNGSGNLTDRYLWGPLVDQVLADEKVTSLSYGGTVDWIANDGIGGPTDVWIRGTPNLADHIQYNAFGGIASQTESWNAPLFGYDGEFTDLATGMQYHSEPGTGVGGRWYLPWSERWMSKDPIFPLSGSNPYEFCNNDPTSEIDPSGLATVSFGAAGDASFFDGGRGSSEFTFSVPNNNPFNILEWRFGVTRSYGSQFAFVPELSAGLTAGYTPADRPEDLDGESESGFANFGDGVSVSCEASNLPKGYFDQPIGDLDVHKVPKNMKGEVSAGVSLSPLPVNAGKSKTVTESASVSVTDMLTLTGLGVGGGGPLWRPVQLHRRLKRLAG